MIRDDLKLLHYLVQNEITHVGQWRNVAKSRLPDLLRSHELSPEEVSSRADLLETFCTLWQQGRGQPVDRDAIAASGAVSDIFLERLADVAEELSGDAEAFLEKLKSRNKDERTKGFREKNLSQLEQYLRENNFIDDQEILTEAELRLRALASPAADVLPDGVANDLLHMWWQLWSNN